MRTALEDLARADAIELPVRGEEIVLCNYRRRTKDKLVKRMGTIAQLVAATLARF